MITYKSTPNRKQTWKKVIRHSIRNSRFFVTSFNKLPFSDFLPSVLIFLSISLGTFGFIQLFDPNQLELGDDPYIKSLSVNEATPSEVVEIKGRNFASSKSLREKVPGRVVFSGKNEDSESPIGPEAVIISWSENSVSFFVPAEAKSGLIYFVNDEREELQFSNGRLLKVKKPEPQITRLSVSQSEPSEKISIYGHNLGNFITGAAGAHLPNYPGRVVLISGSSEIDVAISSWMNDKIDIFVPHQFKEGDLQVILRYENDQVASNKLTLKVDSPKPELLSMNRDSSLSLEAVTVRGKNLGLMMINDLGLFRYPGQILLGNTEAKIRNWTPGEVTFYIPTTVRTGQQTITLTRFYLDGSQVSNSLSFTIDEPNLEITNAPQTAYPSETITVQGYGFGNQLDSPHWGVIFPGRVIFSSGEGDKPGLRNSIAPILSWGENSIQVQVPIGIGDGRLFVERFAGNRSFYTSGVAFSPKRPVPEITELSTDELRPGNILDIFGSGLGFQLGTERTAISYPGQVIIGDKVALPVLNSWTDRHIRVFVPWGSHSGSVRLVLTNNNQNVVSNTKEIEIESLKPKIEEVTILDPSINRLILRGKEFGNQITNPYVGTFNPGSVYIATSEQVAGEDTRVLGSTLHEAKIEFWSDDKIIIQLPVDKRQGWLHVALTSSQGKFLSNGSSYPHN